MNKSWKSLPLLVFALCVAVQQSDSAVSAVLLFLPTIPPSVLHLLRAISYEDTDPGRLGAGGTPPAFPAQVYK